MKRFVTGLAADGRSTILRVDDIDALDIPTPGAEAFGPIQFRRSNLWTTENPVILAHRIQPDASDPTFLDLGLKSAATSWDMWRFIPNFSGGFHRTHTIDLDTIVAGQMDILMEDGSVGSMSVGDCVVVTGVVHGWRSGPEGCTLVNVLVGLAPA